MLLLLGWMLAYTLGPLLHNPAACSRQARDACAFSCQPPAAHDLAGALAGSFTRRPEVEPDSSDECPFCRILSIPYQVENSDVQVSRTAECDVRLRPRRSSPVYSRYHGFSFGARAPPAI